MVALESELPSDECRNYIDRCLERMEAPVKKEHARLTTTHVACCIHLNRHKTDNGVTMDEESIGKKKKSKKERRKERENQKASDMNICRMMAKEGSCKQGDSCRFSHDLEGYLANKEADLAGECPFTHRKDFRDGNNKACPYGLLCRWASKHDNEKGGGSNDADQHKPSGEDDGDNTNNNKDAERSKNDDNNNNDWWWRQDGTIQTDMHPIRASHSVQSALNGISKDLQISLRKKTYDFSESDGILGRLGVNNTMKGKKRQLHGDQDGAKNTKLDFQAEGCCIDSHVNSREKRKLFDARGKTYLAPLTTVGNLPFRRLCKSLGADITCGEMAMATNLLQGQNSEWALLKRHPEEDFFGVQICGGYADAMTRCAQLVQETCNVDFVDINCGCPIDIVVNKGAGSACLVRPKKFEEIVRGVSSVLNCPLTIKMRKGYSEGEDVAHTLIPKVAAWGASGVTIHGRTREQRYSKLADWTYIKKCADIALTCDESLQVVGNGDVYSWQQHVAAIENENGTPSNVATTYVARGALLKPWIFTEIKERRDWDISASERLDLIKKFARDGLEHWGSDRQGVENCRRFLLEWLSFSYRYIPSGLLETLPQMSNWRPTSFVGRSDLETLLASPDPRDWILLSEMVLGPAPAGFSFTAKHKAVSYSKTGAQENG